MAGVEADFEMDRGDFCAWAEERDLVHSTRPPLESELEQDTKYLPKRERTGMKIRLPDAIQAPSLSGHQPHR